MGMNTTFIEPFLHSEGELDFLGFCVSPFTALLGDYFYLVFGLIPVLMMYLKCQDIVLPFVTGIIFTAAFGLAMPEKAGIAILMLAGTAMGAIVFQTFKGHGN